MVVKCSICGERLDKKTAYKVMHEVKHKDGTTSMKSKYFCSEKEYIDKLRAESEKAEMWELIRDIIGETHNTALFKEAILWGEPGKVVGFIKANRDRFNIMNTIPFKTEYGKIRYFSAIIKNNINDFTEVDIKEEPKAAVKAPEMYENKHKSKRRKGLMEYE